MTAFEDFGVLPEIIQAIAEEGWELPTPIQAECIPLILGGGDVQAAAETGSGKTGAFGLAILQIVYEALKGQAQTSAPSSSSDEQPDRFLMSVTDRDAQVAVSEDGLLCQCRQDLWCGVKTDLGVIKGKHYFEALPMDDGLCRVGWAITSASRNLGTDPGGFGFGGTGMKSNRKQFDHYGDSFGKGDVIGCYIDLDDGVITWAKNGNIFEKAFDVPSRMRSYPFHPAVVLKNAEMRFNFGESPFRYPPSEPYQPLAQATQEERMSRHSAAASVTPQQRGSSQCLALIIEPTRELAEQTNQQMALFGKHLPNPRVQTLMCTGGVPMGPILSALKSGACHIVTGTPGKIIDLVETNKLDISNVRFLVLDEADRLTEASTVNIIKKLHKRISTSTTTPLQVLMFSATLHSPEIKQLADQICKFPIWVDLKGKESVPETVHHAVVIADPSTNHEWMHARTQIKTDEIHNRDRLSHPSKWDPKALSDVTYSQAVKLMKAQLLVHILDAYKMDQALIFVRTRQDSDNLEAFLRSLGGGSSQGMLENEYSCASLHSGRGMQERKENLEGFKDGSIRFLICTDVAARGIDVKELPYVINYTLPALPEDYIHRVGRVGRADRMGLAISIVAAGKEKVWYHQCKSKGQNCNNADELEKGGCGLWYDEPAILKAIEQRLGQTIPTLDAAHRYRLSSPSKEEGEAEEEAEGKGKEKEQVVEVRYGQAKDGSGASAEVLRHVQMLKPTVAELAEKEIQLQRSWWSLKQRFKPN
ncbi:ATP-dependent RNA helicase ddx1 [Balamuthia mandrillaris]